MLRFARFSQFYGAEFWIMLFIVTAILSEITWYVLQFDTRQFIGFFGKFRSFRNDICIFLILNPRKKPNKDSTEALLRKSSDWNWRCQRGFGNIYISTSFLSAFCFWKFQPQLYWIFNCDFWIWPLCTFIDRISKNARRQYFLVHAVTSRSDCWIDSTLLH